MFTVKAKPSKKADLKKANKFPTLQEGDIVEIEFRPHPTQYSKPATTGSNAHAWILVSVGTKYKAFTLAYFEPFFLQTFLEYGKRTVIIGDEINKYNICAKYGWPVALAEGKPITPFRNAEHKKAAIEFGNAWFIKNYQHFLTQEVIAGIAETMNIAVNDTNILETFEKLSVDQQIALINKYHTDCFILYWHENVLASNSSAISQKKVISLCEEGLKSKARELGERCFREIRSAFLTETVINNLASKFNLVNPTKQAMIEFLDKQCLPVNEEIALINKCANDEFQLMRWESMLELKIDDNTTLQEKQEEVLSYCVENERFRALSLSAANDVISRRVQDEEITEAQRLNLKNPDAKACTAAFMRHESAVFTAAAYLKDEQEVHALLYPGKRLPRAVDQAMLLGSIQHNLQAIPTPDVNVFVVSRAEIIPAAVKQELPIVEPTASFLQSDNNQRIPANPPFSTPSVQRVPSSTLQGNNSTFFSSSISSKTSSRNGMPVPQLPPFSSTYESDTDSLAISPSPSYKTEEETEISKLTKLMKAGMNAGWEVPKIAQFCAWYMRESQVVQHSSIISQPPVSNQQINYRPASNSDSMLEKSFRSASAPSTTVFLSSTQGYQEQLPEQPSHEISITDKDYNRFSC